jgi:hypothetical protein
MDLRLIIKADISDEVIIDESLGKLPELLYIRRVNLNFFLGLVEIELGRYYIEVVTKHLEDLSFGVANFFRIDLDELRVKGFRGFWKGLELWEIRREKALCVWRKILPFRAIGQVLLDIAVE